MGLNPIWFYVGFFALLFLVSQCEDKGSRQSGSGSDCHVMVERWGGCD